ncbi:hypothetical protein K474DRAFT_1573151, partial [Panus rudis PR-1116 ss-1]
MLTLILAPARGNSGGRYFPYQGYLGLTPLRVEGVVCTRLAEDGKPIPAKSLSVAVRCYESRQGKTGTLHSRLLVDYLSVLWRKPDNQDYADLGSHDAQFKITLPKRVAGFSTAHYQEYRTFWRVEAVLEHAPISGVGSRLVRYYDLPLVRFDVPPPLQPLSPTSPSYPSSTPHVLYHPTSKSPTPVAEYNLSTPVLPIGPSDLVFTSLYFRPLDPSLSVRSASVFIDRRIDLHQVLSNPNGSYSNFPPTPEGMDDDSPRGGYFYPTMGSTSSSPPLAPSSSAPESSSSSRRPHSPYSAPAAQRSNTLEVPSFASPSASSSSVNSMSPLVPPGLPSPSYPPTPNADAPPKTLTSTITYADSGIGGFAFDRTSGVWSKTISLQWPKAKSQNLWAMGESIKSELADVSFWVRVKVIVSSPSGGTYSLDLEPREMTVVSTNDSDRKLALTKFAEQRETALALREKSRDREKERASAENGSQENKDALNSSNKVSPRPRSKGENAGDSGGLKTILKAPPSRKSRRPHTSAGPRDKSNLPYTSPPDNASGSNSQTRSGGSVRPGTGMSVKDVTAGSSLPPPPVSSSNRSSRRSYGHTRKGSLVTSAGTGTSVDVVGSVGSKEDAVRAWEEELKRIETASKRSTVDMLAFFGIGKRR